MNGKLQNDMVFIIDKNKRPFGFITNKRAQALLFQKKAVEPESILKRAQAKKDKEQ